MTRSEMKKAKLIGTKLNTCCKEIDELLKEALPLNVIIKRAVTTGKHTGQIQLTEEPDGFIPTVRFALFGRVESETPSDS